jgi:hypothetical protein
MKSGKLWTGAIALCGFGAVFAGGRAYAQEFPQTTAVTQSSVTQGFHESSLAVLHRSGDANTANAASRLAAQFSTGSATTDNNEVNRASELKSAQARNSLVVSKDGTFAQFEDESVAGRAHSLARPVSQKMSAARLEQAGRAFINSKLAGVIVLGPGEELVPVLTDYRIEGEQNLGTGAVNRSVVANRIMFGRTIHGVPVVGNGSKVVVTFTNDGSLESFRYDWPKYQATNSQDVVDASEILGRVQKVIGVRTGVTPNFSVTKPERTGSAYPVALTTDTSLQKLECGYYDPGTRSGKATATVQPGCVYHAVMETAGGIREGYAGAVPAGTQFEADTTWLETRLLEPGKN